MKGLIFIPDISGFTDFVCNVPAKTGANIIQELMMEMIDHSPPGLKLAEIEGDALLFYKLGKPYPVELFIESFKKMAVAFADKYQALKNRYAIDRTLSLKFILHYGEINVYRVNRFEKLYGKAIVESHSLLKNGFAGSDYLLITEDYLQGTRHNPAQMTIVENGHAKITQHFKDLRDIDYFLHLRTPVDTLTRFVPATASC